MQVEGATQKSHLLSAWKQTGVKPNELSEAECPESLSYLFEWFKELVGDKKMTFTEIRHWSDLTRKSIRPWEVDTIKAIDKIYWNISNGHS